MYRDDPLDDELELRAIVGDDAIDGLVEAAGDHAAAVIEAALDVLRLLQGWTDDAGVASWFASELRRLDGRSPLEALANGALDEVHDAATAWVAARS